MTPNGKGRHSRARRSRRIAVRPIPRNSNGCSCARKAHHEARCSRWNAAELLALDPEHPEALHLLGAVRFQQGGSATPSR